MRYQPGVSIYAGKMNRVKCQTVGPRGLQQVGERERERERGRGAEVRGLGFVFRRGPNSGFRISGIGQQGPLPWFQTLASGAETRSCGALLASQKREFFLVCFVRPILNHQAGYCKFLKTLASGKTSRGIALQPLDSLIPTRWDLKRGAQESVYLVPSQFILLLTRPDEEKAICWDAARPCFSWPRFL